LQLVDEAKTYNENLKIGIALNREIGNTQISRAVEKELQKTGIQVFENHIKQRVTYAEVMGLGKTVMEVDPEGTAALEFSKFFFEVLKWTGQVQFVSREEFGARQMYERLKDQVEVRDELIKNQKKLIEEQDRLLAEYKAMERRAEHVLDRAAQGVHAVAHSLDRIEAKLRGLNERY
jgi:hypothetical protein